jgi:2-oxoglutarate dehydrogenase E1 component
VLFVYQETLEQGKMRLMEEDHLLEVARANSSLVEDLYERYLKDPKSVSQEWITVFKKLELLPDSPEPVQRRASISITATTDETLRISHLIESYRIWGYLAVSVNPIALKPPEEPNQLKLQNLGFHPQELSKEFPTLGLLQKEKAPLLEIIDALKKIYTSRIGYEYIYKGTQNLPLEKWIQDKIEQPPLKLDLTIEQKQMILEQLNKTELLESFLHTKFPGQKRFSIEGGETLIPMLAALIERGAELGASEYVLGMTHRGRLNVLANILNKSYTEIFSEFDEGYFPDGFEGTGDVKYHKGFLSDSVTFHGHQVKISLTPNPSHLESVDPVVEGQVKAKQMQTGDELQLKTVPILVHGDASISGQGVVYETLQLSRLSGYSTGGTVHLVINNQIGFTTVPEDSRSTRFCTDIAKTFDLPVFHVNAEDPVACVFAAYLAAEIRQKFHLDVFLELNCYRKYGHNESDEPAYTQPLEYQMIRAKKSIRELFRLQLVQEGTVEKFMAESLEVEFKKSLQDAQAAAGAKITSPPSDVSYKRQAELFQPVATAVSRKELRGVADSLCFVPKDFSLHPKLQTLLKERKEMVLLENKLVDWGVAELLAYGTLLVEGTPVRLSGQDCGRGTFSHRHALWMDQKKEMRYYPLNHLKEGQARADVINSPLSEFAILAFEYGYSIASPETLVLWEAQFGDFGNGAQVVIDQYIASAEAKWAQKASLALLLPHGYEGQGPEHSSSRLERYLSLAADDNLWIVQPSTPSQLFHLLRRQVKTPLKKPLICLTPKQLLRHPLCVSKIDAFEKGGFQEILDDPDGVKTGFRIIFCTGKIYYELSQLRTREKLEGLILIRIEQLYPLHKELLKSLIDSYGQAVEFLWVQEEPKNMGAWSYIHPLIEELLPKKAPLKYLGRQESASPATGSYVLHKKELAAIFQPLLENRKPPDPLEIRHFDRA